MEGEDLKANPESGEADIEADISKEVAGMKRPKSVLLFRPMKVDVQCGMLFMCPTPSLNISNKVVIFFKTQHPIQPVSLVHRICSDAFESSSTKRSRWVKRLTPMTMMGKATEKGLQEVCVTVLQPSFHIEGTPSRKVCALPLPGPIHTRQRNRCRKRVDRLHETICCLKCR